MLKSNFEEFPIITVLRHHHRSIEVWTDLLDNAPRPWATRVALVVPMIKFLRSSGRWLVAVPRAGQSVGAEAPPSNNFLSGVITAGK